MSASGFFGMKPCGSIGPHEAIILVSGAKWDCGRCAWCISRNAPDPRDPLYPTAPAPRLPSEREGR